MKTINIKLIGILSLFFLLYSCESTELDLQIDPSELSPQDADPNLLLNNVQLDFASALNFNEDNEDGINVRASEFVRMQHLFGAYTGPFSLSPAGINSIWTDIYSETLQDIRTLEPLTISRNLPGHIGVAKLLEAYLMVTLVDIFGKVPYSEAFQGGDNPNPKTDNGDVVYDLAIKTIDRAILDILASKAANNMPKDLFYDGDADKWIQFANTLKLKMYVQTRLVDGSVKDKINALISEGKLINSATDDFEFKYSSEITPSDSRHPYFALNYDADGADDYLNSYYVNLLKADKGFEDPRLRYYFYRQTDTEPTGDDLPCEDKPASAVNFCYLGDSYWTRDHGNNEGVPPDGRNRSTYGLYPIGGAYDADNFEPVNQDKGAKGAGIFPILLSSYSKFLQAEAALMLNTNGDPKTLLESAIQDSMDKVTTFQTSSINLSRVLIPDDPDTPENELVLASSLLPTKTDIQNYIDFVLDSYDAATTQNDKLNIIMKEYYIALWGNGIEAYNNYRRTSMPLDISDHVSTPGSFPRSFLYPANFVNLNSSVSQKNVTEKVFWDTNPDNLK